MNVLSIGTDRNLFKPDAAVRARIIEYGELFDELHIIVFSVKSLNLISEQISDKVWIYPTSSRNRLLYLYDAWQIGRALNKSGKKFEVITAQDAFETGLVAWWLKLEIGSKLQLQIHTDFLSPNFKKSPLNWFRVGLAKFLLPRADGIRVVSQIIAASIKKARIKLKAVPTVLPIWVDVEKLRQTPITTNLRYKYKEFEKIILMVSRLEPEKQIDLAIKNLADFLHGEKTVGLVIVGAGAEELKLKNLVKEMGLESVVKFEGWQENLATYYKTADLFLTTSRYEGYGVTIVEATACGLPVVATDVGVALEMGATIIDNFSNLSFIVKKILNSPIKINAPETSVVMGIREWPTKEQYLIAYRKALEI